MIAAISSLRNRSDALFRRLSGNYPETVRTVLPFVCAVLTQFFILLSASLKGLHKLPFMGVIVILVMDIFGVILRLASGRRMTPLIAYVPQTLLCFGIAIQAAAATVRNVADSALKMNIGVRQMAFGLMVFVLSFFLYGLAAWLIENCARGKWIVMGMMILPPLLTAFFGTKQNDAKTAIFGLQLYQLTLIFLVFLISAVFHFAATPGKRAVFFIVYLSVLSFLFFLMREFGTLFVIWVASIVAILTDIDFRRLGLFSSGGFVFIKNIFSVPAKFIASIPDRIIDRINPAVSDRTRKIIKRVVFYTLLGLVIVAIAVVLIFKFPDICDRIADIYHRKVEKRIYPWLDIGDAIDTHQESLSKSFVNAGWFGREITECILPPHFEEDCTMAMLFQLFGWVGGIIFLGLTFAFLWAAHTESFRGADKNFSGLADVPFIGGFLPEIKRDWQPVYTSRYALTAAILLGTQMVIPIGSSVKLFPIIGVSTPMLSGGGVQYVVFFSLLGIIVNQSFTAARDSAPLLSDDRIKLTFRQRVKKIANRKPVLIGCVVVFSLMLFVLLCLGFTLYRFNGYVMEKADQMNRIDYHFSMAVKYDPPKEVADISVAEDPDIHNLLLIGLDSESASGKAKTNARSDSMILISLNRREKTVKVFSLQRDTFLRFANGMSNKLNACYQFGGMPLLCNTITMNYRIPIHTTCSIDRSSFKKIIDAMGGVDLKLSEDEADYLNKRPKKCHLKRTYDLLSKGKNHLDGWQTLEFVRMRHANLADNDYNRTSRQQEAIGAMLARIKEIVKSMDVKGLMAAVDAIAEEVDTNISGQEVSEILPDAVLSLLSMRNADGKLDVKKFHVPDRYYSDSYYEYRAWRLKPDLRRTAKLLRYEMYGRDSLKGIE